MTLSRPLLISATAALVLAACSFSPSAPKTRAPPPSSALYLDQPVTTVGSAYGAANADGAYLGSAIHKGNSGAAQETVVETTEEIVFMGPDDAVRIRPTTANERYQDDADSCYASARGEIAHDARVEFDMNAAFENEARGLGLAELRKRMNNFERAGRMPAQFNRCMPAKGYGRR